jgi:hypothetical protein
MMTDETSRILYRAGYKYQLQEPYVVKTALVPEAPIDTDYIALDEGGRLTVKCGYAWDGPSGPTIDTSDFMRGSLVHDALYQLLREQKISQQWRKAADKELYRICVEDGMSHVRAWYVYCSVRLFASSSADPTNEKPVITAPETVK